MQKSRHLVYERIFVFKENILFYINAKISSLGEAGGRHKPRPALSSSNILFMAGKLMADRQEGHTKNAIHLLGLFCRELSTEEIKWRTLFSSQQLIK